MNDPFATLAPTSDSASPSGEQPERIGRYRVERMLGRGGFGVVWLAHDEQLERRVAIKVPHRQLVADPETAQLYLAEARIVASLDHPNIVPVHDVGKSEEFPFFIVSKFIEGRTLAEVIARARPSLANTAELIAIIAEALRYAHKKGLVHRDLKPGNILVDPAGKPFVLDFGLALKDADVGQGPRFAGTPAYMSPEQARGEGHRVDGRSDIFRLGVVLYELLARRRPFRADSQDELLEQVTTHEPRPLRQTDDNMPRELERICFKALAKRPADRYMTAQDMADDLRQFLAGEGAGLRNSVSTLPDTVPAVAPETPAPTAATAGFDSQPVSVVPKGLRSFGALDRDFFLELLPGPRDRDGLPDSIRFWKTRIEETDADNTFAVGLIYGPSGCGKSSLVKAGLLPRLAKDVAAIYVEATAGETETRLLNGLRKRCPELPATLGLKDALAALRVGPARQPAAGQAAAPLPSFNKVLIVVDQFEQWLHAKKGEDNTELVQALRQCDGARVQCVVMVRDDFWMAATRFMREIDHPLLEGQNSAAVDLFPPRHAEKVLAAFGRAFGALPPSPELAREQRQFLELAIKGLTQEGKVICVRLALFAEMMKGKAWTPAALKAVGGTEGVGATFLEETFSASGAPPEHRYHQTAVRAVLKALLPESGTDIKGHMRAHAELLALSGYAGRPRDFDDLIRILDAETRLITPTDPEGVEPEAPGSRVAMSAAGQAALPVPAAHRFYQLSHDYLVHSLRDWLTRKQKETYRGRAELVLADRAAVWNVRPESRQLPTLWQWACIRLFSARKRWTPPQRKMMRKANWHHSIRVILVVALAVAGTAWGVQLYQQKTNFIAGFVDRLVCAQIEDVPKVIGEMEGYHSSVDPKLIEIMRAPSSSAKAKLRASLALLPADPNQVDYLYGGLLDADSGEIPVIREALAPHKAELVGKLWAVAEAPEKGKEPQRLRAACALALYDPADKAKWRKVAAPVVEDLLAAALKNPSHYPVFLELLRPAGDLLVEPLATVFRSPERADAERRLATSLLAEFAAQDPNTLAGLLMDADAKQFAVLFPIVKAHGDRAVAVLAAAIDQPLAALADDASKERLAKQQANAAVALLKLHEPAKAWPLLKHSADPRARSYLIHRVAPLGVDPAAIVKRLDSELDVTARRALILSLGDFGEAELSPGDRSALLPKLHDFNRNADDAGLHAAAEWLLRTWKQDALLKEAHDTWMKDGSQRDKRLAGIGKKLAAWAALAPLAAVGTPPAPPEWYVNRQGQEMVVIPGPVKFAMGAPATEAGRNDDEPQHLMRIGRTFAIGATPITVEQYRSFDKAYRLPAKYVRAADLPVVGTSWYQAAAYCNWLSKEEGIAADQWCFATDAKGKVTALKPNYLSLAGYRLPTEAEMEFATRAGAVTSRYYGETEELLPKYAWYLKNAQDRTWPVGSLKPNDFGLFDTHGNVFSWCQESYKASGNEALAHEDREDGLVVGSAAYRALRGGSFDDKASILRSAYRVGSVPSTRLEGNGFRVARTLPPGQSE